MPVVPTAKKAGSFFADEDVVDAYARTTTFRPGEAHVLLTYLVQGGSLLEVGCGAGRVSLLLAERFAEIRAFDIIPEMVTAARARAAALHAPIHFFEDDITTLSLAKTDFDNIVFMHSGIEGIDDDAQRENALRRVFAHLRPGGRFIFTTKSVFTGPLLYEYALKPRLKWVLHRLGAIATEPQVPRLGRVVLHEEGRSVSTRTSNPFTMKRILRRVGFELLYFNGETRLAREITGENFRANFCWWDHFFVCQKPR